VVSELNVRVAFIGIGNMGRPMARRMMAAGFPLMVHDANAAAAKPLIDEGAHWAQSPEDAASQCDVICTSLPGPREFEQVVRGDQGVLRGARRGAVLVDFTTNSPRLVRQLGATLADRGLEMLDAPVSGGVEAAAHGALTALVGGKADTLSRMHGVLESVAKTILHVGDLGTASVCKVLHNCAVFCTNLAMIECLTAGVKAGVDATTLIDVFQKSGLGRNLDLQVALPATLFRGQFEPRFALKTAYKDMGLAIELARACHVPMKMADHCAAEMAEAVGRGWGDSDNTRFLVLQEERAGVEVRI
jgi:3-hydroxyisobutyrate dehydrogenase